MYIIPYVVSCWLLPLFVVFVTPEPRLWFVRSIDTPIYRAAHAIKSSWDIQCSIAQSLYGKCQLTVNVVNKVVADGNQSPRTSLLHGRGERPADQTREVAEVVWVVVVQRTA